MEVNGTIFLQILIFLSLLLWLSRSLFAPLLRLFDEREKRIVGAKTESLELGSLADEKSKAFDLACDQARKSGKHTLSELKQALEKEHQEALALMKARAKEKLDKAQSELLEQEKEVRKILTAASSSLADDIVAVLLRKPI